MDDLKLKIQVLTLFPEIFKSFFDNGMIKRALEKKLLDVNLINIRNFAEDKYSTVDDTPYGGGAGMIMRADILVKSLKYAFQNSEKKLPSVILLTPQGRKFDQTTANRLSVSGEFILVCGRYRGIDERFTELYVNEEISIGDYVLTGGEPAAMVIIDAVSRLIPGVLHDFESGLEDSFQDGFLDCPWYTKPRIFEGKNVPDVLLSGDHEKIKKWRREQSYERTVKRRPDIIDLKKDENKNK